MKKAVLIGLLAGTMGVSVGGTILVSNLVEPKEEVEEKEEINTEYHVVEEYGYMFDYESKELFRITRISSSYDDSGRIAKESYYFYDAGEMLNEVCSGYYTYEYGENGLDYTEKDFMRDSSSDTGYSLNAYTTYQFDSNGNLVNQKHYVKEEDAFIATSIVTHQYDSSNREIIYKIEYYDEVNSTTDNAIYYEAFRDEFEYEGNNKDYSLRKSYSEGKLDYTITFTIENGVIKEERYDYYNQTQEIYLNEKYVYLFENNSKLPSKLQEYSKSASETEYQLDVALEYEYDSNGNVTSETKTIYQDGEVDYITKELSYYTDNQLVHLEGYVFFEDEFHLNEEFYYIYSK